MPTMIYTWQAILKALQFKNTGDDFSIAHITEMIKGYRGQWTGDENVSRRLREFNAGEHDRKANVIFRCENIKDGVYRITRMDPKPAAPVVYAQPEERLAPVLPPVDGNTEYKLF